MARVFDVIRMLLRKGTLDDPFPEITEEITIINNKANLNEIPDSFYHVRIDGYTEIHEDYFNQVKKIEPNQFLVDYQTGFLYFNEAENGKTLTVTYKGRGVVQIPASRIWVHSPNPWAVDNLQEFIDLIFSKIQEINDKVLQFTIYVDTKTTQLIEFIEAKKDEFVNYINQYIALADAKIVEMDNTIDNCQTATIEAQNATIDAINATIEARNATEDLEIIKEEAIQATNDAIVATQNAIQATEEAIEETNAMRIDRYNTRYVYAEPVENYGELFTQYPNPEIGLRVMTKNNGNVYRWNGINWAYVENLTGGVPVVNANENGLMSPELYVKLMGIEEGAEKNLRGEDAKMALPNYFRQRTFVFVLSGELFSGVQNVILQAPRTGIIRSIKAFAKTAGVANSYIQIEKIDEESYIAGVNNWTPILANDGLIIFEYAKRVANEPIITQQNILENDILRVNIVQLAAGLSDVTIQISIEI